MSVTVLEHCVLIDGTGAPPVEDATLVIDGERIVAAGAGADVAPRQADRRLDLRGQAVLPGLINLHVHYGLTLPGALEAAYRDETESALALRMALNAREALRIGVTTTRSVGERYSADLALRDAVARGRVPGPRIFASGQPLGVTGGHGVRPGGPTLECDGPYEFRKAARGLLKLGADQLKIMLSGGLSGQFEAVSDSQMARDEIEAVVLVAHGAGKRVCAHAGPSQAMLAAIEAGVDCLEHGYFLNDAVAERMVERGTYLVPTICVSRAIDYMRRLGFTDWHIQKSVAAGEQHWAALQTAIRHGVKLGMGTDMLPADWNEGTYATYREMELMGEAGLEPMQVLCSATAVAAEVIGAQARLGTLEPGKLADLIACPGNPAEHLRDLRELTFVMQGGEIIRDDGVTSG
jgi:imidazolonepropionase-like amidohydrolase